MTTNSPEQDGTNRIPVWVVAVGVALVVGVGGYFAFSGGDDSTDDGGDAASEAADEPAAASEPAQDEPSEDEPSEDEPAQDDVTADADADEAPEPEEAPAGDDEPAEPLPTIVIGQDENGDDIVVEIEVTKACAQTFHEPLDENSFSFIRWTYDAPGLEPGLPIRVSDDAGFEFFTVVTPDRKVVVEQGITSYGDYPFPSIEWNQSEDVQSSITPTDDHTVDDSEGEASETCISDEA